MEKFRELFRACSEIKGFDGWVIGKLHVMAIETSPSKAVAIVVKQRKHYAVLELPGEKSLVRIHLFPWTAHRTESAAFLIPKGCRLIASKVFLKEEIQEFTEAVQDNNKIHREGAFVVPGALIMEWLWDTGTINFMNKAVAFRQAVYAQEEMKVYFHPYSQTYFAIKNEVKFSSGKIEGCLLWNIRETQ